MSIRATDPDPAPLDVLFLHVGKAGDPDTPIELLPMGVPAMADWLARRGRRVEVVHVGVERTLDPTFDPVAYASRRRARVACVDLHWHAQATGVMALVEELRRALPDLRIVLGGYTASAFADELIGEHPEVDAVVRGDGEIALAALVDAWLDDGDLDRVPNVTLRRDGAVWRSPHRHVNGARDLGRFRYCAFDTLRHREVYNRAGRMERRAGGAGGIFYANCGRGCPYDCVFCGGSRSAQRRIGGRERVVYRPVAAMVDDLARMADHGLTTWYNTFHPSPDDHYFLELYEAIAARGLRIGGIQECLHLPSPAMAEAFAGTFGPVRRMDFVVLTGGEELRRRSKGNPLPTGGLLDTLEGLARLDVEADLCFLTGLPGEQPADQEDSLRLVERARARHPRVRVQAELLAIEPLAPMNVDPVAHGITSSARTLADYVEGHRRPGFVGYRPDTQTVDEARARAAALEAAGRRRGAPVRRLRVPGGARPAIQLHDIHLWDEGPRQGLGIPSLIAHALGAGQRGVGFDHRAWRAAAADAPLPEPAPVIEAALDAEPAVVGFTMTPWSERTFRAAIDGIRRARPSLPIVVGGPLATCDPAGMLDRIPAIDLLVSGYGEQPFASLAAQVASGADRGALIASLAGQPGVFVRGIAPSAPVATALAPDGFPSPHVLGLLDPGEGPCLHVEWSRGCAGRCAYCAWGNGQTRILPVGPARIREEIAFARRQGIGRITINDAALNAPGYPLEALCDAVAGAAAGSTLRFTGFLRYEHLDDHQLDALGRVPFERLNVGLQTDDDRALRVLGRPPFDRERFRHAVGALSRLARVGVQIISGLPGDTYDAFQRRLHFLLQLDCDVTVFPLQAPPGTELWRRRQELGIEPDPEREHVVFRTDTLTAREHRRCLALARRLTAGEGRAAHGVSAGVGVDAGLRVHVDSGRPLIQLHQANVDDAGPNFGLGVPFLISHVRRQPDLAERYELEQVAWPVDHPDRFAATVDEIVDAVVADDPLLVGFSVAPWSYARFLDVIRRLRVRRPALPILVGGPNACIEGAALLRDVPEIDLLVPGEGELPFAALLRTIAGGGDRLAPGALARVPGVLSRRAGEVVSGPAVELPAGALDYCGDPLGDGLVQLRPDRGRLNLEWTRGCPNRCTYCAWPRQTHSLRRFGEGRIRSDLAWARDHGFDELLICDAAINHDREMLADLCRVLAQEGRGLAFSAFLDWPSLGPDQAALLARVRWSRLMIGLQTDDDEGLRALGRRRYDAERFRAAVASLSGITVPYVELMTGVPGDSGDKIRRRVDLALSLGCRVSLFPLLATRGTDIWRTCRDLGAHIDPAHQFAVRALPTMPEREYAAAIDGVRALGSEEVEVVGYHFLGRGPPAAAATARAPRSGSGGEEGIRAQVTRLLAGWGDGEGPGAGWRPEPDLPAAQVADLSGVRIGFVRGPDSLSVDAYDRSQVESPLAAGDALAFCPGPDGGEPAVLLELCRRLAALDAGSDHG